MIDVTLAAILALMIMLFDKKFYTTHLEERTRAIIILCCLLNSVVFNILIEIERDRTQTISDWKIILPALYVLTKFVLALFQWFYIGTFITLPLSHKWVFIITGWYVLAGATLLSVRIITEDDDPISLGGVAVSWLGGCLKTMQLTDNISSWLVGVSCLLSFLSYL